MKIADILLESTTTLNILYSGNWPERNEQFWDYVRPHELDEQLTVHTMPSYKLKLMLLSQYRVEHLDELVDMLDDERTNYLNKLRSDPHLSNKIIVVCNDRVIDGNHRALAAALNNMSISYVNLEELGQ
jgi:hypothetical protein